MILLYSGLPLFVLALAAILLAWHLGEATSTEVLVRRQFAQPKLLFQSGINFDRGDYKIRLAVAMDAEILAIGTSRSGQWRSAMFRPYRFVNAGFATWTFREYRALIESLPQNYRPRVLLFNLDFIMFGRHYAEQYGGRANSFERKKRNQALGFIDDVIATLAYAVEKPRILIQEKIAPDSGAPTSGILCITSLNCYRSDGSMHYGRAFRDEALRATPFKRIGQDENYRRLAHPWMYGTELDALQKAEFEAFVAAANARGIALVGVQMPYHPNVFENTDVRDLAIIKEFFSAETVAYFKRLGVNYFDYSKFVGGPEMADDRKYWLDAFHPTEAVVTRLLMKMSQDEGFRRLLPKLDVVRLEAKWNEFQAAPRAHPFDFWGEEF